MRTRNVPDVTELRQENSYKKLLELDFREMVPFVLQHIRSYKPIWFLYTGLTAGVFVFILLYVLWGILGSMVNWGEVFRQSVFGVLAGSILVIPVHELLHGLAYRTLGAKQIRFGADMKQFIIYVTAHHYPITGRELIFLAMTPFVVINLVTVIVTWVWVPDMVLLATIFLLSHNIMCIGDFAITSYILKQGKASIYSFDDTESMKSYFYTNSVNR